MIVIHMNRVISVWHDLNIFLLLREVIRGRSITGMPFKLVAWIGIEFIFFLIYVKVDVAFFINIEEVVIVIAILLSLKIDKAFSM